MSKTTVDLIRERAEADLESFIKLLAPHLVLGDVHKELIGWWNRSDAKSHQLTLLPRAHQKSRMIAYRVAWEITRNPAVTILYLSATANLAEQQLKLIKDILSCATYTKYWPDMLVPEEGRREKWTLSAISVDHPKRKLEGVRDPTIFTGGLTTSLTGMHCDIAVLDDVVVQENAYSEDGRSKVESQYSLLSSIENPDAREWAVGTRYHPKDLYQSLIDMEEVLYNPEGDPIGTSPVYEVFEKKVEDRGDGTGEFIWPKQRRADGKYFGFDTQVLAKKKAQYLDQTQFRAQYYNDPNDPDTQLIKRDQFQYYDRGHVKVRMGKVWFQDKILNVMAAMDLAYTVGRTSDYTAIVVAGMDSDGQIYILDIARFKTDQIETFYKEIEILYNKWNFRRIRIEANATQSIVVRELTDQYIRPAGLALAVEPYIPPKNQSKEDRIFAVLQPRYKNLSVFHYVGGNCQVLEEELVLLHPPHDDTKDALTSVIEILTPASRRGLHLLGGGNREQKTSRFGGYT